MSKTRNHSPLMRLVFLILGLGFTALGFVGAFLPLLPTVPFLLLAAGCFARSSERLEHWLLSHPQFGPLLTDWRERGAIPKRAKLMALGGSTLGLLLFVTLRQPGWPLGLAVAGVIAFGMVYVFTRPSA